MAESTGAAVVIVAHLNKGQSTDPIQRLGGSIGLAAAARSVLLLGRDPDDPEGGVGSSRVLAHVKSNFGPLATSRRLEIETVERGLHSATARITERGPSQYSGSALLASEPVERIGKLDSAIAFLQSELAAGPKQVADLQRSAESSGFSLTTLNRAKSELGVESDKVGQSWQWELPGLKEAGGA
jgi:DNA repair protein RadA/Sms